MNFDGGNDKRDKLSDDQKKKNHIESERKRREAIRGGFEKLSQIVPGLDGQARSEAVVLMRTVEYLQAQLAKKDKLKKAALANGMSEGDFEQVYRDAEAAVQAGEDPRARAGQGNGTSKNAGGNGTSKNAGGN